MNKIKNIEALVAKKTTKKVATKKSWVECPGLTKSRPVGRDANAWAIVARARREGVADATTQELMDLWL